MRRGTATVSVLLAGLVMACSAPAQYAVPDDVCGVAVDGSALAPLLPRGKKLDQTTANSNADTSRCRVRVDERGVLSVESYVTSVDNNPVETKAWELVHPAKIQVGDDARVGDAMAIAVATCTYRAEPRKFVVQAYPFTLASDLPKRRDALTRFMEAYFPAAKKAAGCAS
ncbi:hypothetical protein ACGFYU_22890 [Streptomyces sp. NPDC048337]|uniref:hypothetical protein n=1 Tax=Streptomyces sp. NPDC048337 TaxID=3365535 RepID=UPI00371DF4B4